MENFLPIYYFAIASMFVAGMFVGTMIERSRWSDLIHRGILPKPRKG